MFGKVDPAVENVRLFAQRLDREKLIYTKYEDKKKITLGYDGENFKDLTIVFLFDDDGESVAIRVWSIEQFNESQLDDAYEFCNRMNHDYRWLSFYVDSDNELTIRVDAILSKPTVADECLELLHRTVSIMDKVCGELYN
jgi:hypothetical protein